MGEQNKVPAPGTLSGILKAVSDFYINYARISGRTGRAGVWQAWIVITIVLYIGGFVFGYEFAAVMSYGQLIALSWIVGFVALTIPGFFMFIRRVHDIGWGTFVGICSYFAPIVIFWGFPLIFSSYMSPQYSGHDYSVYSEGMLPYIYLFLCIVSLIPPLIVIFRRSQPLENAYGEPPAGGYTN